VKNILFLEGNIKIGKSIIILNNIANIPNGYIDGFFCQRLTLNENLKAFRLVCAKEAKFTTMQYDENMPDIFLEEISGMWKRKDEVFRTTGIELLSDLSLKKLVLLDEIGGFELLIDEFREKLYEVLSGDIPVLGVIKSNNNRYIMQNAVKIKDEYVELYDKLRLDIVNEFGGKILDVNQENISYVDKEVKEFLNNTINLILPITKD